MNPMIPGTLAILAYLAGAGMQWQTVTGTPARRSLLLIVASVAVISHGLTVFVELFSAGGINLGLFPMVSLMAASITALLLLTSFRREVENLFLLVFPFAAVAVALELLMEGSYTPRQDLDTGIVLHIALSVIAYSLLTIAAAQAAMLSFGDYELRRHNLGLLQRLPALQTMEALLFESLWAGLIFLTLSIASGFLFVASFSGPGLVHHTVITLAAWGVFAVLLWGRHRLGWRGVVASRWALSGFIILVIGYFGSKIVLELVLGRG